MHWEAVADRSARATWKDGDITLPMLFHFQEDGLIDTARAEARGRLVGGKITSAPWQRKTLAKHAQARGQAVLHTE